MKDKTKNILKIVSLIGIILLLAVVLVLNILINSDRNSQFPEEEHTSSEEGETVYKISEYNGKLAIFLLGDPEPIKVYDLFLNSLPPIPKPKVILAIGIIVVFSSTFNGLPIILDVSINALTFSRDDSNNSLTGLFTFISPFNQ